MLHQLFISRSIDDNSPIRKLAIDYHFRVTDQSLIIFSAVAFSLPRHQWLFFYSKSGVKYFFDKIDSASCSNYKIICFGSSTAAYCRQYGEVQFHCDASIDIAMALIKEKVKGSPISFICGKNSIRSVHKLMNADQYEEVVVYDHRPKYDLALEKYEVAILTSPMNVEAFFMNHGWAERYIAIGKTTAAALLQRGVTATLAERPSEEGIAYSLKKWIEID